MDIQTACEQAYQRGKEDSVIHAAWVESNFPGYLTCSNCKDCYVSDEWLDGKKWNYCPECGARMDKKEP